jgi:type VI secretion system protein ImpL
MLKYIISALLIIVVWLVCLVISVDLWPLAALFTVLVIGVLVGLWLLRRWRARRAARELEKALAAQAAEQATRSGDLAEVQQMQREFQQAIETLKSSNLARGGQNALYALPWHVIIGPPGSGKTTALRNSGLQFPYSSSSGGGVKGLGGTRNCDWWLTNQGVLLDTAGRWTTEDDDRMEWNAFLDLLKKFRDEKPLNGVIAAVGLDELGGKSPEEVRQLALRMRERIDEIQNRLEISLPVYVLFTKADLIPGFVETFGDLGRDQRGQIWGFTAPLATPLGDAGRYFEERFEELMGSLERRALVRMADPNNRDIGKRELIHGFPQQFATVKANAAEFVGQVFEPSVLGQSPLMRGAYFTSGTQEGRPIDRVMRNMAEAFGIRGEVNLGEPVTEAKSYFLRDMFVDVVFQDEDVAVRSEAALAADRRRQFLAAGGIVAVALLLALLPAWSWIVNRGFLRDTRGVVDAIAMDLEEGEVTPPRLDPLRERVDQLREFESGALRPDQAILYPSGLYQPVSSFYSGVLMREVVDQVAQDSLNRLSTFVSRNRTGRPDSQDARRAYEDLKFYLLISGPKVYGQSMTEGELAQRGPQPHEPQLWLGDARRHRNWLRDRLAEDWEQLLLAENVDVNDEVREAIQSHSETYVQLLQEYDEQFDAHLRSDEAPDPPDPPLRVNRSDATVQQVRDIITRGDQGNRQLQGIERSVPVDYDLNLDRIIGGVNAFEANDYTIPGAYTRRGWLDGGVRDLLYAESGNIEFEEAWVLGEAPDTEDADEDLASNLDAVRREYFDAYIRHWLTFLRSVHARAPNGQNEAALAYVQDLTRGDPAAHRRLFQAVMENTFLEPPPGQDTSEADAQVQRQASRTVLQRAAARLRTLPGFSTLIRVVRGSQSPDRDSEDIDLQRLERIGPEHVFVAFQGFAAVGAVEPQDPPEEGETPPPLPSLPLDGYEEQLLAVRDALVANQQTPDESTAEALDGALATARTATLGIINRQEIGWRPTLFEIFAPPLDGTAEVVARSGAGAAGRSWCNEVVVPYNNNIRGGYPLQAEGHDLPLEDFAAFYNPAGGTLWGFYDEVLQRRILQEGGRFEFNTRQGIDLRRVYDARVLQYLERARAISADFFPPGAEGPTVGFDIRLRPSPRVATQEFCLGGTCIEYHNGPEEWTRFTWPGEDPTAGASLEIRGAGGIHERLEQGGEWGLFRLLEQGTITDRAARNRVFTVVWRLRSFQVDITADIRPVRGDNPFFGGGSGPRTPFLDPLRGRDIDPPERLPTSGPLRCRTAAR